MFPEQHPILLVCLVFKILKCLHLPRYVHPPLKHQFSRYFVLYTESVFLYSSFSREQPIFSARAHVFQIDPTTKRNWIPASKHAVTVSFFYDANRNVYRIISVGGTKVRAKVSVKTQTTGLKYGPAPFYS